MSLHICVQWNRQRLKLQNLLKRRIKWVFLNNFKTFPIGALDQEKLFNQKGGKTPPPKKKQKQRAGFVRGGLKTLKRKVIQKSEVPERKAVRSQVNFFKRWKEGGKRRDNNNHKKTSTDFHLPLEATKLSGFLMLEVKAGKSCFSNKSLKLSPREVSSEFAIFTRFCCCGV